MAEQKSDRRSQTLLHSIILPTIGSSLAVAYATGRWGLSAVATGLAITGGLALSWRLDRALIQPRLKRVTRDWMRLGLEITFSLLGHVVGAFIPLFACSRIFDFVIEGATAWIVIGGIVVGFPIVHGTETTLRYYRQLKAKERLEEQLRVLANQAELKALKAQINPHFLFNTLNTIAQLTHTDPALAEATIEQLAQMFRYVLAGSERGLTPLEEELAFVDSYLKIEQARFGERLRVTREIAPETLSAAVPSLILQPLVENAVRHGQGADGSIDLAIRAQRRGDEVVIAIADLGPGIPSSYVVDASRGVGLRNVAERLRKTYGEEHALEIAANDPHGTVVTVRIPAGERV